MNKEKGKIWIIIKREFIWLREKCYWRLLKRSFIFRYWYNRTLHEFLYALERADLKCERELSIEEYKGKLRKVGFKE